MIAQYVTDSSEAVAAIAAPGLKHVWIHGSITYVYTGADVPPKPKAVVASAWGIRKALNQLGWRAAVDAAVAAGSQDLKDGWSSANEFERFHPLVLAIGSALAKTEAEMDNLFELANVL